MNMSLTVINEDKSSQHFGTSLESEDEVKRRSQLKEHHLLPSMVKRAPKKKQITNIEKEDKSLNKNTTLYKNKSALAKFINNESYDQSSNNPSSNEPRKRSNHLDVTLNLDEEEKYMLQSNEQGLTPSPSNFYPNSNDSKHRFYEEPDEGFENKIMAFDSVYFEDKDKNSEFHLPNLSDKDSSSEPERRNSSKDITQPDTKYDIPPLNMMALNQVKRVGTANVPIKNVYQATARKRESLGTARTARRMVNQDTQREIIGNVWINDLQGKTDDKDQEEINYANKSSLGLNVNAKKSTNIEEEAWIDEYENIFNNGSESGPVNFLFSMTNNDKKDSLQNSSIMSFRDKFTEKQSFSSMDTVGIIKSKANKKGFEIEISEECSDLEVGKPE